MKSLKSKIKKVLLIALGVLFFLVIAFSLFIFSKHNIMFWDYPKNLSDKIETIEVSYIAWACDCANWLPIPRENPDAEIKDTDCIFIEPATPDLEVPDSYWQGETSEKKVRLTGSYYNTKGIPKEYSFMGMKPDKAKVFRYTKMEVLER